jgi:restriction system protein
MIQTTKVRAALLTTYAQAVAFLRAMNGTSAKLIRQMIALSHEQTGTPQNPVDWVNHDK